jgi:formylmethanofuran dehydrogenase subunit E
MPKEKGLTEFEKMLKRKNVACDICGEPMIAIWGGGWDNDRFLCSATDCGAEIVYPTSKGVEVESETDGGGE